MKLALSGTTMKLYKVYYEVSSYRISENNLILTDKKGTEHIYTVPKYHLVDRISNENDSDKNYLETNIVMVYNEKLELRNKRLKDL